MKNSVLNILIALGSASAVLLAMSNVAYAAGDSNCQIVYGGGEVCDETLKFTIDKQVKSDSKGGVFVDNIGINNGKLSPDQTFEYKIVVKNTGEKTISKIDVADTLPQYIEFVDGDVNYNADTRTLSYSIENLEQGDSHELVFQAKTHTTDKLPSDKGIVCTTNTATAVETTSGNRAEDASEVCIEKTVTTTVGTKPTKEVLSTTPLKETPDTGVGLLSLVALIPTGAAGLFLRKKAK